ncbi:MULTISPECIES: ROK family protein [unclassified Leeuwenhoekiella]|uniref:ROK family protein n=1 Tax=unclassified Leeuwenhoekiella TaxID=2615029 RepID=UPI0025BD7A38|nr:MULTISPECIES: ROK family protein [unclassified Leeuwenhoekiella]|tara:strand:- start:14563 stop:15705 length:1143 start_codon:yes stop_codon:yes gene_type:complete
MRDILGDERIVMTLDAGGTNFVFSALQAGKEIITPITLRSHSENLEKCLRTIVEGFNQVKINLEHKVPHAISFAFPGPADYKHGVIGDLINLPAFRGGIALGPMLEELFEIPTLINNDGDLFAYGESVAGFLPFINKSLECAGSSKRYKNLIGITLGTGYGGGIVVNNQICLGDNSAAGEIWLTRNFLKSAVIAEESVSIRAIQRVYSEKSGTSFSLTPLEIFEIASEKRDGNKSAAIAAFEELAVAVAESLANAIALLDAPVVIGGGIAGASKFIIPKIIEHLSGCIHDLDGKAMPRVISKIYDVDNDQQLKSFLANSQYEVTIPFSNKKVVYDKEKRIAIGISKLGTSTAVCLGAYALALDYLDKTNLYEEINTRELR